MPPHPDTLTQSIVVPLSAPGKAAQLGVHQLWAVWWRGFELFQSQYGGALQELPAQSFSLLFRDPLHGSVDHQAHFMPRYKQKERMYERGTDFTKSTALHQS